MVLAVNDGYSVHTRSRPEERFSTQRQERTAKWIDERYPVGTRSPLAQNYVACRTPNNYVERPVFRAVEAAKRAVSLLAMMLKQYQPVMQCL